MVKKAAPKKAAKKAPAAKAPAKKAAAAKAAPKKAAPAKKAPAKKAAGKNAYDADQIQILEGLAAVRKRPGMYIGGTGTEGLHHLAWEIIDNCVDEAAAGFASHIEVILHKDGSIEVSDDGRGIPTGKKADGRTALEVVYTELHAGGKFGSGAYSASGGLHGVGASVVNALSSKLVVEVDRDGVTSRLVFNERVPGNYLKSGAFKPGSKLAQVKKVPKNRTGTRVRYWADLEIFDDEARIEYDQVREHVARVCFLVPGLHVKLHDKRRGGTEPEEFVAAGGLADYVDVLSVGENVTDIIAIHVDSHFEERVPVDGKMQLVQRPCTIDIAMRWVKGYESNIVSFVNTIPTREGGTHVAGFEQSLNWTTNNILLHENKKLKKLKDNGRASSSDAQEGLIAAVKVTFAEPQFKGQTKQELGTPPIRNLVYEAAKTGLSDWMQGGGRKTQINALRDKMAQAVLNRVAAKQQLENRRKLSSLTSTGMPDKLADCRRHGPDSELLIVEGNSAAGPAKNGRDSDFMAVLPLRGKVVNAAKATLKQVVENAEASALITAIGGGSGDDFDVESCRYGRIIILCDADVDGSHIRCLLLTLIFKHMRPLLEHGMVYAAQPPLFSVKHKGEMIYAYSDEERDQLHTDLGLGLEKRWQRFKGLGEMNVDELADTTLNPETRVLKRMSMSDAAEAVQATEMFRVLMGNDVADRKDYIVTNSKLLDPDVLDV